MFTCFDDCMLHSSEIVMLDVRDSSNLLPLASAWEAGQ